MSDARAAGPMRVLLVAPSMAALGGQSVQAELLLTALARVPGLEVALQPIDPAPPAPLRWLRQIRYVRTAATSIHYYRQLRESVAWCDVVHAFSASYLSFLLAPVPAILVARSLSKPFILNYHSGEAEDHLARSAIARNMIAKADRLVVPSDYLHGVFARHGLRPDIIHNAVDLRAYLHRERPAPKPAFLVNRSLEPHYNVGCVIRAFAHIQEAVPDAALTVAGEGSERSTLEDLARSLRLRRVNFRGRVSREAMPGLYNDHDFWLNASNVDNMPVSILEAFASGVAVVSTSAGGIPHVVEHRRTGMLSPCDEPLELARNALALLADPSRYRHITSSALAACAQYSSEVVVRRWIALYREMARRTHKPGAA